jgi:hypothetical protein
MSLKKDLVKVISMGRFALLRLKEGPKTKGGIY